MAKVDSEVIQAISERLFVREVNELKDPVTFSGARDGYSYILYLETGRMNLFSATLTMAVAGPPLPKEDVNALRKEHTIISSMSISKNVLTIFFRDRNYRNTDKIDELNAAVYAATLLLRKLTFYPCCANCGEMVETGAFLYYGRILQLCAPCEEKISREEISEQENLSKREEKWLAGLGGALIGSLIGTASIILLGRIHIAAFFSGFLVGALVPWLYERFAGKITRKGKITCVVLLVLVGIIGCYTDELFSILPEIREIVPGITFFEAFFKVLVFGKQGILYLDTWIVSLIFSFFLYAGAAGTTYDAVLKSWYLPRDKRPRRVTRDGSH